MQDFSWFNALSPAEQQVILEGPAILPPSGEISIFDHPPNRNSLAWGIIVTSIILCITLVLLRLYSRIRYHRKVHIEDGIALIALGTFAGYSYCYLSVLLTPGFFVHMWHVRFKDAPRFLYYLSVASITYAVTIALLKVGILIEWTRIFVPDGARNAFWWTCYVTLAANAVFFTIITFVEIFGCNPREKLWNITIPGTCLDVPKVTWIGAIVNFVSDMIILLLPQKMIWGLHMSVKKKFGLAALFAVGIFSCICAGFRIKAALNFAHTDDILYATAVQASWATAECVLGFFVLCIPSLSKLVTNSPWCHTIAAAFGLVSRDATKRSSEDRSVLTIGRIRKRKEQHDSASLFTDSDFVDCTPLAPVAINHTVSKTSFNSDNERGARR